MIQALKIIEKLYRNIPFIYIYTYIYMIIYTTQPCKIKLFTYYITVPSKRKVYFIIHKYIKNNYNRI